MGENINFKIDENSKLESERDITLDGIFEKDILNIDIDFIEFYIKKKYSQKLEEYFGVNKSVSSKWRNYSFPERRLKEFSYREGTLDTRELFSKIYS